MLFTGTVSSETVPVFTFSERFRRIKRKKVLKAGIKENGDFSVGIRAWQNHQKTWLNL